MNRAKSEYPAFSKVEIAEAIEKASRFNFDKKDDIAVDPAHANDKTEERVFNALEVDRLWDIALTMIKANRDVLKGYLTVDQARDTLNDEDLTEKYRDKRVVKELDRL